MRLKSLGVILVIAMVAVGCRSMTGRSLGQNIDDKTITASVKAKLVGEKASNLTRVGVDTVNGTVYLTGTVDTPDQKARAEQVAREVKGVTDVVNNIQVASASAGGSPQTSTSGTR
jgi:osmotically-inducible protein OsmY